MCNASHSQPQNADKKCLGCVRAHGIAKVLYDDDDVPGGGLLTVVRKRANWDGGVMLN